MTLLFSLCTQWELSVWVRQNNFPTSCTRSQSNPTAPVPTEVPAFPPYVQLLNGPLLAAGQSSYSGMNIHDLMCLHKIHLCIYKIYKHIKHNKLQRLLCALLKQWVWEYSSCVCTETKLRGRQKIFLCLTCYLSPSPRGAMQITRGCEVFALVINSLYPFCARTILATLPLMSIFIKDYLAHCVLKNINFMLHTFPKNKTQSCLTLCFWIINCSFSFILLPTLQNCKPK